MTPFSELDARISTYTIVDHLQALDDEMGATWLGDYEASYIYVTEIICRYLQVSRADVEGRSRVRPLPEARQLIDFCMCIPSKIHDDRVDYHWSLEYMGSKRGRDHASLLHGVKMIRNFIQVDVVRRRLYQQMFSEMHGDGYRWPLVRMQELVNLYLVRKSMAKA